MKIQKKIPILVLAYSRPVHLSKTLLALKKQENIAQHDVYLFVDGLPLKASADLRDRHEKVVEEVKHFHTSGRVVVHVATKNRGVLASVKEATRMVLKEHDAFIYLEEDIVPLPGYVDFMNKALLYYENHKEVYAVNGFSFGEIADLSPKEGFFSYRFCPWGFGTWKDQWESCDFMQPSLGKKKFSLRFWRRFHKDTWGWGLALWAYIFLPFIRKSIQPWDILFSLCHYQEGRVAYFPPISWVRNEGMDESGLHGKVNLKQEEALFQDSGYKNICFSDHVQVNLNMHCQMARRIIPIFRKKTIRSGYLWLKRKGAFWNRESIS